jgi:hypothetical protein
MLAAIVVGAAAGLIGLAGMFWGSDSRPGFRDGRTDYRERFFPHSRDDY